PMQAVLPNLGNPTTTHLHYAGELRGSFPAAVQDATRDPFGASALIYTLLISADDAVRAKQLQLLGGISAATQQETERLLPQVVPFAMHAKLPLVDLALPSLKHLSAT